MNIPVFFETRKVRKVAHKLTYRRREEEALSSHEQVMLRGYKRKILICQVKSKMGDDDKRKRVWEGMSKVFMGKYLDIIHDSYPPLPMAPGSLKRTIEDFSLDVCGPFFRFRRSELHRICKALSFPEQMTLSNRESMAGEEVMLRGLYELVSGDSQFRIAENVFGGGQPLQSRAFSAFINHVYDNYEHLVHDNLKWFHDNGLLEESATAIGRKMESGIREWTPPPGFINIVCAFIDCNCLATSCVGGGPTESGANSMRWDPLIQEAFYNGWKSCNGLKHQTVDVAHGITIDMKGPCSLRRNDLYVLRESNINARMKALSRLYIFGDSAYKKQSNLTSYLCKEELPQEFKQWNNAMKSVRISIEWNYGYTASIFTYLGKKQKLKVLSGDTVAKVYTVCTILRNIRVMLRGSQCSNYFGLTFQDNFLEHYLTQTPLR